MDFGGFYISSMDSYRKPHQLRNASTWFMSFLFSSNRQVFYSPHNKCGIVCLWVYEIICEVEVIELQAGFYMIQIFIFLSGLVPNCPSIPSERSSIADPKADIWKWQYFQMPLELSKIWHVAHNPAIINVEHRGGVRHGPFLVRYGNTDSLMIFHMVKFTEIAVDLLKAAGNICTIHVHWHHGKTSSRVTGVAAMNIHKIWTYKKQPEYSTCEWIMGV